MEIPKQNSFYFYRFSLVIGVGLLEIAKAQEVLDVDNFLRHNDFISDKIACCRFHKCLIK